MAEVPAKFRQVAVSPFATNNGPPDLYAIDDVGHLWVWTSDGASNSRGTWGLVTGTLAPERKAK